MTKEAYYNNEDLALELYKEQEDYVKSLKIFKEKHESHKGKPGYEYFEVNEKNAAFYMCHEDGKAETLVFDKNDIRNVWFDIRWTDSRVDFTSLESLDGTLYEWGDILKWGDLNTPEKPLYIYCDDYEGRYDDIDFDDDL